MQPYQVKEFVEAGLIFTRHAQDKMITEHISRDQIKEVLLSGLSSKSDTSVRNNRENAWNERPHQTITFNNITVVFCVSKEYKCLIISVYHGFPHRYLSNPNNRRFNYGYR